MFTLAGKLKLPFLILIYLTNTFASAEPEDFRYYVCGDSGNYTRNSTYQTNLNTTLSTLHTTNSGFGFFNLSTGQGVDGVHSAALCQGDMDPDLCLTCLNDSIVKLPQVCPNQKEAVGYYGRCLLKYSNVDVIGNMEMEGSRILVNNQNAADTDRFVGALDVLMNKLKADAAAGDSLLKFATGNTTGSDFGNIYGLVQCTPDLSEMQCTDCVEKAHNEYVTSGYRGKIGGTVFKPMCRYSYDVQRFFNGSTMVIPAPPPPQVTPPVLSSPPPLTGMKILGETTRTLYGTL
ncbi:putative Gnk2-like domain-containing protein [Helianthus anomalus]